MNVSSSSSFPSNFERNRPNTSKRSLESVTEATFKTSNPQIFPSLHPLSPFYRERTKVLPSPAFKTPKTINPDPVKKMKMNDESETVAIKEPETTNLSQEIENQKISNNSPAHEEFRVPKRPARFDIEKKKTVPVSEPAKQPTLDQLHEQFSAVKEPLVVPDTILDGLKALQTKNLGFMLSKTIQNRNLPLKEQVPQPSILIPEPVKPTLINQNPVNGLSALGFGQIDLKSIYTKLEVEYLSLQLIQKAPHLFKICQQNQQKLSKNFKDTPENDTELETEEDEISEVSVDSPTSNASNEDLEEIKEENVKQEIHC